MPGRDISYGEVYEAVLTCAAGAVVITFLLYHFVELFRDGGPR